MGAPKLATTQRSLCCPANAQQASELPSVGSACCRCVGVAHLPQVENKLQDTICSLLTHNRYLYLVHVTDDDDCAKYLFVSPLPFEAKSLFWLPRSLWIDSQASCLSYGQQIAVHIVSINTYYNVFIMHLPFMCCERGFKTSQQLVANRWFSMFLKLT